MQQTELRYNDVKNLTSIFELPQCDKVVLSKKLRKAISLFEVNF